MLKQRTLRNSIKAEGIGLHTGKNIAMELLPAEINTGINFIRTDVNEDFLIPAIAENVYIIFNAAYWLRQVLSQLRQKH
jgi:UDP-3-O-[3-hydroxymyristoyl] N-acetylglucosamine deacetylase